MIEDKTFLQWIYDRLVVMHKENPHYDYMIKLKEIVDRDNEIKSLQNQIKNNKNCIIIDEPRRESKHQYFLKIARLVSSRSTCPRRSVGCVITNKFGHIKSTGYNGVPRNFPHCTDKPCGGESQESSKGLSSCMATHAEQNALLQCDNVMDIETIYTTTSPCITCAKLIANTSCKEVIYSEEYADTSGIDMLKKLNIKTTYERIND